MTQRPLFAKATKFRRPKRITNRYGDTYRVWLLADGAGKVLETRGIMGIALPRQFKAIVYVDGREFIISRHRKLRPAQLAVVRATEPKPTTPKRRKVRR